jgi:acetylornithine deacetylase
MYNAHMDTVGVEGMPAPFSGEVRDGKLYGRGSQDMKASLAAMLAAARALVDSGIRLKGDLLIAGVADEEYASIGTDDLVKHYHPDAAIVTEPTDLALGRAHRGFIWYEVHTTGRAAHGSRFDEGIDAIMHMGRFLASLDQLERELRQRAPHPLTGPPSLHASIIQGGTEPSIYPADCQLDIERRTIPGETVAGATQELQQIIDRLGQEDQSFTASLRPTMWRAPFEIESSAEIAQVLERAMSRNLSGPPRHIGATFWTDAAILAEAGIPTALIGPLGAGLHSAEEWVDLPSTVLLASILRDAAIDFCG